MLDLFLMIVLDSLSWTIIRIINNAFPCWMMMMRCLALVVELLSLFDDTNLLPECSWTVFNKDFVRLYALVLFTLLIHQDVRKSSASRGFTPWCLLTLGTNRRSSYKQILDWQETETIFWKKFTSRDQKDLRSGIFPIVFLFPTRHSTEAIDE